MLLVAFGLLLFACPDKFIFTNFEGVPRLVQFRTKQDRLERARVDARAGRLRMYGMRVTSCKNPNKIRLVSKWSRKPMAPRLEVTYDKPVTKRSRGFGKWSTTKRVKSYKKSSVRDQVRRAPIVQAVKHPWLARLAIPLIVLGILEDTCFDTFPEPKAVDNSRSKKETTSLGGGMQLKGVWTLKNALKRGWKKHKRLIVDTIIIIVMLLVSIHLLTIPIAMPLAVIDSTAGGNWSAGPTWVGGVSPGTGDDARIMNTHNVVVDIDGEVTGSCEIQVGGTLTLTGSNKLICDDENAATYAFQHNGTLVANTSIIEIQTGQDTLVEFSGPAGNAYDIIVNTGGFVVSWVGDNDFDNDLTVTAGTFRANADINRDLTVIGNVIVNGTLGRGGTETNSHSYGSLTINAGGEYDATSGMTDITDETGPGFALNVIVGGTFTHNDGLFRVSSNVATNLVIQDTNSFYDFESSGTTSAIITGGTLGNLNVTNDLTIGAAAFLTRHGTRVNSTWTVGGDVDLTGWMGNATETGASSFGSLTINAGGEYSATSGTTEITSETGGGLAVYTAPGGTLTSNNGSFLISTDATTVLRLDGTGNFYNLTLNPAGNRIYYSRPGITIDNNFSINNGTLDTDLGGASYALTVNGVTTIGDGVGAASSSMLTCGSSTVIFGGLVTLDSDGEYSAPDAAGAWHQRGNLWNDGGIVTHNDGTMTVDSVNAVLFGSDCTFNNISITAAVRLTWRVVGTQEIEGDLALTNAGATLRWDTNNGDVDVVLGTATSACTISNIGTIQFDNDGLATEATLRAASASYPVICTGNDWDWDFSVTSPARGLTIQDLDYRIAMTTGGGGVTITSTRCKFTLAMTVTVGDAFLGTDCAVPRATMTVNGDLLIDGWHETRRNIASVYVMVGGDHTFAVNTTYTTRVIDKLAGCTITVDPGVVLTLNGCSLRGRPIMNSDYAETDLDGDGPLIDTNNGTVTVNPLNAIWVTAVIWILAAMMMAMASYLVLGFPVIMPLAIIDSNASGNWSAGGSWVGGVPPATGDEAVILNTHAVTVDGATTSGSVEIQIGGTLLLNGQTLTLDSSRAADWYALFRAGTFTHGDGTVICSDTARQDISGGNYLYNFTCSNTDAIGVVWAANITIGNDLIVDAICFMTYLSVSHPITVAGDVDLTGKLGNVGVAAYSFGSLTINAGGEYDATSGITTITDEAATGRTIDVAAGGTLSLNNGTFELTLSLVTFIRDASGTLTFYNLIFDNTAANTRIDGTTNLVVNNALSIDSGGLDTNDRDLTVNGTTNIGDGVGAPSSAQLVCNSSDVDLNGNISINTDGEISAPDSSGNLFIADRITSFGLFTHNGGTVTADDTNKDGVFGTSVTTFFNLTVDKIGLDDYFTIGANAIVENIITNTRGGIRVNDTITLTVGTAISSGTITTAANGFVHYLGTVTIQAASANYPIIATGTDWEWDGGTELIVTDLDYRIAATTGGGGVTVTSTRCRFTLAVTISANDQFNGTDDAIERTTLTVNGGLFIDGHHDTRRNIASEHILIGGDHTITANVAYNQQTFEKLAGSTLTVDVGVTLTLTDCIISGLPILEEDDLVDTVNGTVTINPSWDDEGFWAAIVLWIVIGVVAVSSYFLFGIPIIVPLAVIASNNTGGGNWSAGPSWNGGVAPVTGDDARIVGADNVAIDQANEVTGSVEITNLATLDLNGNDLECDDENAAGHTVQVVGGGIISHNNGSFTLTYGGTALFTPGAGNPLWDVIINNAAADIRWNSAATIEGDLTMTAGEFTLLANLIVAGQAAVAAATLTMGGFTVTIGNIFQTGGTVEMTTATLTLNLRSAGDDLWLKSAGVANHNGGTVVLNPNDGVRNDIDGRVTFNDLTINSNDVVQVTVAVLTMAGDLTLTATTGFQTYTGAGRAMNITGSVTINGGVLDGLSGTGDVTCQYMLIHNGGTYSATAMTTILTHDSPGDSYNLWVYAGGTFTHNDGTVETQNGFGARMADENGTLTLYNYHKSSTQYQTMRSNLTIAGDLDIDSGWLTMSSLGFYYDLTINGDCTVGDGIPAINQAYLYANEAAWDFNGALLINSDGNVRAPDSGGTFNLDGAFDNYGFFDANGGTITIDLTGNVRLNDVGTVEPTFYNMVFNGNSDTRRWEVARDITVQNQLTITRGIFRLRTLDRSVTITVGTATTAGAIVNNAPGLGGLDSTGNNGTTIQAASPTYPIVATGGDWDWDVDADNFTIQDLDYRIVMVTGGGGVTIAATRCKFAAATTITANDALVGSDCAVERTTLTVNGALYIDGHHDSRRNIDSEHILIGGDCTIAVNLTYVGETFEKMAGSTLTIGVGVTLELTDCTLEGRPIFYNTDALVDTIDGTFTVNPSWEDERFTSQAG